MPEGIPIEFDLLAKDNLTPILKELKSALSEVGNSAAAAGQQISKFFGPNIATAFSKIDPQSQSQVKAYIDLIKQLKDVQISLNEESKKSGPSGFQQLMSGQAAGGGVTGRLVRDLVWGAESFLRYMVVWKSLDLVLQGVQSGFQSVAESAQVFIQLNNRMGGDIGVTSKAFTELASAAMSSGTSIAETFKNVSTLYQAGMGLGEATSLAGVLQLTQLQTGINLIPSATKAQLFEATPTEIRGASEAGGPYAALAEPAKQAQQREAMRSLVQFQFELQQTEDTRELQDTLHNKQHTMELDTMIANRRMTLRQQAESQTMEDTHYRINDEIQQSDRMINREMELRNRMINQEIEDNHRVINQEMEDRHRAINYEMTDRHRIASQTEEDQERRISHEIRSIDRAREGRALQRREANLYKDIRGLPWEEKVEKTIELQEDEKIYALRGQEYQIEDQRYVANRQREKESRDESRRQTAESINENRKQATESRDESRKQTQESFNERNRQQDESHANTIQQHNEDRDLTRRHQRERQDLEYNTAAKRMEFQDDVYEQQRDLERRAGNFRAQQEYEQLKDKYQLNLQYQKTLASEAARPWISGGIPGAGEGLPMEVRAPSGYAPKAEKEAAERTGTATEATLQQVQKLLEQVLGGK